MGYWDSPEGTNCVEKTWITTKMATALGLVGTAYHMVAYEPETAMEGLQRAGNNTVTMATMGAIFGMVTCLTAQARESPDDPVNYFVGGCASGIFLGAKTHNAATGTMACLALGTLGYFSKAAKKENWAILSSPKF
ncbi:NADH dehydrogenase [ubiquinone] 1 alpha subcomplex subunit 11 [Nerophis lumbriciformis]|uniref:NADH dehydrogenase [ubiquinone] 1 alpha subcomplex subunit 11 n=1 Tax=Nerophis lumbriciformis TaxID=546530 RepID=UPI002ADFD7E9|nr:NADH dehydrogenase [ubiquinone] 1 alpha subcomplex subunit 11-like [Nerophis lumbriciformis]